MGPSLEKKNEPLEKLKADCQGATLETAGRMAVVLREARYVSDVITTEQMKELARSMYERLTAGATTETTSQMRVVLQKARQDGLLSDKDLAPFIGRLALSSGFLDGEGI